MAQTHLSWALILHNEAMSGSHSHQVLLYYWFTPIANAEEATEEHRVLCERLNLKGRILIAPEGINGTVSGTTADTNEYIRVMHGDPRFAQMPFKIDPSDQDVFRKLFVRTRKEIITLGPDVHVDPNQTTGIHLTPKEWRDRLAKKDYILLDGRNNYESMIGRFEGAICPDLENFRDFPQWIRENLGEHRDKPILTYCTGGIRCEKLSGFMIDEGFKEVYQLLGGIVEYGKDPDVRGEGYEGKCYVFDERIAVPVGDADAKGPVSTCYHCGSSCDRYVNCSNVECNLHYVCCDSCLESTESSCSPSCREAAHKRKPFEKLPKPVKSQLAPAPRSFQTAGKQETFSSPG